jgi:sRNA-binding regulator protein Hfq
MPNSKTLIWRPDRESRKSIGPQAKPPADRNRRSQRGGYRRNNRRPMRGRGRQRQPLSPEKLAQIRAEGYGRSYIQKQIRRKTPMVFELYDENVEGIIVRRLTYALDVLVKGAVRRIEKIHIKYMYKQEGVSQIIPKIEINEKLREQKLVSIAPQSERYQVEDRILSQCYKEQIPIAFTLRGGEIIKGRIDWFSQYEIKVNVNQGKAVVVFRHSLHSFEMGA